MHHDIAIKYVFSHVAITIGLWRREDEIERVYDDMDGDEMVATPLQIHEAKQVAQVNFALLQHIIRTPNFARNVNKLTIRAYSLFQGAPIVYEIGTLVHAIEALHNLTAFAWYGPLPTIPCEIMDALLRSSGEKVVDILLHPEIPEELCLNSFTNLRSLVFTHRFCDMFPTISAGTAFHKTIHQAIAANSATLRRLDVYGNVLCGCPPASFSNLLELTLVLAYNLADFAAVFEHCRQLRGFTFCGGSVFFADVLRTHPGAFPHLTSFKLLSLFEPATECIEEIATFLKNKKLLRRVDLLTNKLANADEDLVNVPFLKILSELPRLEVLGIDVQSRKLTPSHIKLLLQYIPPQISALFVLFDAHSSDVRGSDWQAFLSKHDLLRYLHMITFMPLAQSQSLNNAIFEHPPPRLELLGLNNGMRWVTARDLRTRALTYSEFWPQSKVYFRTVEHYDGCEDWEWLLRHHGHDDGNRAIWCIDPPDAWMRTDAEDAQAD